MPLTGWKLMNPVSGFTLNTPSEVVSVVSVHVGATSDGPHKRTVDPDSG